MHREMEMTYWLERAQTEMAENRMMHCLQCTNENPAGLRSCNGCDSR